MAIFLFSAVFFVGNACAMHSFVFASAVVRDVVDVREKREEQILTVVGAALSIRMASKSEQRKWGVSEASRNPDTVSGRMRPCKACAVQVQKKCDEFTNSDAQQTGVHPFPLSRSNGYLNLVNLSLATALASVGSEGAASVASGDSSSSGLSSWSCSSGLSEQEYPFSCHGAASPAVEQGGAIVPLKTGDNGKFISITKTDLSELFKDMR